MVKQLFRIAVYLILMNEKPLEAIAAKNILTLQHKIISPFLKDSKKLLLLRNWMNSIVEKKAAFQDYDGRTGISWVDFEVDIKNNKPTLAKIRNDIPKMIEQEADLVKVHPESLFKYPAIAEILLADIVPTAIEQLQKWTAIPKHMFVQTWINRLEIKKDENKNNTVGWHQDPGSSCPHKADYSLILLLNDRQDPDHGWEGGKWLLKSGKAEDAQQGPLTIIPECNQAILFDNKNSSHAVTQVHAKNDKVIRDILITTFYLKDPSIKN